MRTNDLRHEGESGLMSTCKGTLSRCCYYRENASAKHVFPNKHTANLIAQSPCPLGNGGHCRNCRSCHGRLHDWIEGPGDRHQELQKSKDLKPASPKPSDAPGDQQVDWHSPRGQTPPALKSNGIALPLGRSTIKDHQRNQKKHCSLQHGGSRMFAPPHAQSDPGQSGSPVLERWTRGLN